MRTSATIRAARLDTDALWINAHNTLLAGEWSNARAYLDELGRRPDNRSTLCTIDTYMKDKQVEPSLKDGLRALLGDRIDWVNSRALAH